MTSDILVQTRQNGRDLILFSTSEVVYNGRKVQKSVFGGSNMNFCWRVNQVIFAVFVTLATLGLILCCKKGRRVWARVIDSFKHRVEIYVHPKLIGHSKVSEPPACLKPPPLVIVNMPEQVAPALDISPDPFPQIPETPQTPVAELPSTPHSQSRFVPPAISKARQVLRQKIEGIFIEHPTWEHRLRDRIKDYSLSEQLWLLRVFELSFLEIKIPVLEGIIKKTRISKLTPEMIAEILKKREAIKENLDAKDTVSLRNKQLTRCPECLGLLENLTDLDLSENRLSSPPDLAGHRYLEKICLMNNALTEAPNFSFNPKLKIVNLGSNELTKSPDLSKNPLIEILNISCNKLSVMSDLSKCPALQLLDLSNNFLFLTPVINNNPALKLLILNNNKLTLAPDVKMNKALEWLRLDNNQIVMHPDLSQNINLKTLNVSGNPIALVPDYSNLTDLEVVDISSTKLPSLPDFTRNSSLVRVFATNNPFDQSVRQNLKLLRVKYSSLKALEI